MLENSDSRNPLNGACLKIGHLFPIFVLQNNAQEPKLVSDNVFEQIFVRFKADLNEAMGSDVKKSVLVIKKTLILPVHFQLVKMYIN